MSNILQLWRVDKEFVQENCGAGDGEWRNEELCAKMLVGRQEGKKCFIWAIGGKIVWDKGFEGKSGAKKLVCQ